MEKLETVPNKPRREKQEQSQERLKNKQAFAAELSRQLKLHRETHSDLLQGIVRKGERHARDLFRRWASARNTPSDPSSFALLNRIERR
jgi:hypothetical protein